MSFALEDFTLAGITIEKLITWTERTDAQAYHGLLSSLVGCRFSCGSIKYELFSRTVTIY